MKIQDIIPDPTKADNVLSDLGLGRHDGYDEDALLRVRQIHPIPKSRDKLRNIKSSFNKTGQRGSSTEWRRPKTTDAAGNVMGHSFNSKEVDFFNMHGQSTREEVIKSPSQQSQREMSENTDNVNTGQHSSSSRLNSGNQPQLFTSSVPVIKMRKKSEKELNLLSGMQTPTKYISSIGPDKLQTSRDANKLNDLLVGENILQSMDDDSYDKEKREENINISQINTADQ